MRNASSVEIQVSLSIVRPSVLDLLQKMGFALTETKDTPESDHEALCDGGWFQAQTWQLPACLTHATRSDHGSELGIARPVPGTTSFGIGS